jgi:predicted ArsR family transcriptional regulator
MQATEVSEPKPRKPRIRAPVVTAPKSKKDQLIELLQTKGGADVRQMSEALEWLPHTVRAALTGLRKANIAIEKISSRDGGPARYRISSKRVRT